MAELAELSVQELRAQLKAYNISFGPLTAATRSNYEQKLTAALNGETYMPTGGRPSSKASSGSSGSGRASAGGSKSTTKGASMNSRKADVDHQSGGADDGDGGRRAASKKKSTQKQQLGDEASEHVAKMSLNGDAPQSNGTSRVKQAKGGGGPREAAKASSVGGGRKASSKAANALSTQPVAEGSGEDDGDDRPPTNASTPEQLAEAARIVANLKNAKKADAGGKKTTRSKIAPKNIETAPEEVIDEEDGDDQPSTNASSPEQIARRQAANKKKRQKKAKSKAAKRSSADSSGDTSFNSSRASSELGSSGTDHRQQNVADVANDVVDEGGQATPSPPPRKEPARGGQKRKPAGTVEPDGNGKKKVDETAAQNQSPPRARRGIRDQKNVSEAVQDNVEPSSSSAPSKPVKKPVGRPKKQPLEMLPESIDDSEMPATTSSRPASSKSNTNSDSQKERDEDNGTQKGGKSKAGDKQRTGTQQQKKDGGQQPRGVSVDPRIDSGAPSRAAGSVMSTRKEQSSNDDEGDQSGGDGGDNDAHGGTAAVDNGEESEQHEQMNEGGKLEGDYYISDFEDDLSEIDGSDDDYHDIIEGGSLDSIVENYAYPCRHEEFSAVYRFAHTALCSAGGAKGCSYISGVPGTGKTATVRQVIVALKHERARNRFKKSQAAAGKPTSTRTRRAESEKPQQQQATIAADGSSLLPDFVHIEVNGMRMMDAKNVFVRLYQGVLKAQGYTVDAHATVAVAEKYIADLFTASPDDGGDGGGGGGSSSKPTISKGKLRAAAASRRPILLVVDELDALSTKHKDILYKLFEYAQHEQNKFVLITIANTMDLTERHLPARVASRLAMSKVAFQPYTHDQLAVICERWLQDRLETDGVEFANTGGGGGGSGDDGGKTADAFRLAARKVANISGDARRVIHICERALLLAEEEIRNENGRDDEQQRPPQLTVHHINAACDELFKSPKFAYVRDGCTPVERAFLLAYLDVIESAHGDSADSATLDDVYTHMQTRARMLQGNGNNGGRATRANKQNAAAAAAVDDARLLTFHAAEQAMMRLRNSGILVASSSSFMLAMSTADARRALEMGNNNGGGP